MSTNNHGQSDIVTHSISISEIKNTFTAANGLFSTTVLINDVNPLVMLNQDTHAGVSFAGLTADAKTLTRWMRSECLSSRYRNDSALPLPTLISDLSSYMQPSTQGVDVTKTFFFVVTITNSVGILQEILNSSISLLRIFINNRSIQKKYLVLGFGFAYFKSHQSYFQFFSGFKVFGL